VGTTVAKDELYRLNYDGSVQDEPGFMAMGGQSEAIAGVLRAEHSESHTLGDAVKLAVKALASIGGEGGAARTLAADQLEVAILDRAKTGRTFRRVLGAALVGLLNGTATTPKAAPKAEPAKPANGDSAG
jgi:proteasome alpha subunit